MLPPERTEYTFSDVSPFFAEKAKAKFAAFPFMSFAMFDIDRDAGPQGFEPGSYDLVVAGNVLHDARDVRVALRRLRMLLAPDGLLLFVEGTQNSRLQLVTIRFIEAMNHFEDERLLARHPLHPPSRWLELVSEAGFTDAAVYPASGRVTEVIDQHVFTARRPSGVSPPGVPALRQALASRLPKALVPTSFVFLEALPLTANGKVDRSALAVLAGEGVHAHAGFAAPRTATEVRLAELWREVLGLGRVGIHDDFLECGGDSLLATKILSRIRAELGVELPLRTLFELPTVAALADALDRFRTEPGSAVPDPSSPGFVLGEL